MTGTFIDTIVICTMTGLATILGWNYYSEKCLEYLVGTKRQWCVKAFRVFYVAVVFVGPYLTVSAGCPQTAGRASRSAQASIPTASREVFNGLESHPC